MNRSPRLTRILLLVASAASLGFLLFQVGRARDVAATLAAAQNQREVTRRDIETAARRARQNAQPPTGQGNSVATQALTAALASNASPTENVSPGSFLMIARNPKLRALHFKLVGEREVSPGPKRLAALQLRPEQIERLRTAAIQRETARLDLAEAAHANGLTMNDPGIKRMSDQLWRDYSQEFRATIGTETFARLREGVFSKTPPPIQQPLADWLAGWANMQDAPMDAAQGAALGRILSENTKPDALRPGMGYWARAHRVDWDAALPKIAQAGFTAAQIAAIAPVIAEHRSSKAVEQLITEVMNRHPEITSLHPRALGLVTEVGYDNAPKLPPPLKR